MRNIFIVIAVLIVGAIGAVILMAEDATAPQNNQTQTEIVQAGEIDTISDEEEALPQSDSEELQMTELSSDRVVQGEMRDMRLNENTEDMSLSQTPESEEENETNELAPTDAEPIGPVFGIAMHGEPKYADGDTLSYVNPAAPKGGILKMHSIGTFDNVNPFILKGSPAAGSTLPFDTLLYSTEDEAFSEYGLLAESFEMPADRSSVTFNLRPEAKFHDGEPVTADDVVWTIKTLQEKGHPFYRAYYANVVEAVKEDDHRVRFDFDVAGNRELPLIMGQMPVLPEHYWVDKTFESTTLTPPLGSGPYKVASIDPGRSIAYERVKDYWAKDLPMMKGIGKSLAQ